MKLSLSFIFCLCAVSSKSCCQFWLVSWLY